MNTMSKVGIVLVAVILLALQLLVACGGDETEEPATTSIDSTTIEPTVAPTDQPTVETTPTSEPTSTPEPEAATWEYNISYADQATVATVSVVGEETVDGVDCYVTETSYDAPKSRSAKGTAINFLDYKAWLSKSDLDEKQAVIHLKAMGTIDLTTTVANTYGGGDHGVPFSEGNIWTIDALISLDPQLQPDSTSTWNVRVAELEEVTVPAGTFNCFKVESRIVAIDGVGVLPDEIFVRTEWWAVDEDFICPVKVMDDANYDDIETWELVSYTSSIMPPPKPTAEPLEEEELVTFYRNPDYPIGYTNPVEHLPIPQHPFLRPKGQSNMHCDGYMSDTYEASGPLGTNSEVSITTYGSGLNVVVTLTFDSKGRIVTVLARNEGYQILLIDQNTLDLLASYDLPLRLENWPDDPLYPYGDPSGGAYFVLDNQDRVLVTTHNHALQIIQYDEDEGNFQLVREYDLSDHVVPKELPVRDHIGMTLPDWEGRLWYITRYGIVGTVDEETDQVRSLELEGEEIQNSFTVGEDGVYILTDHAMYRLHADEDGVPVIDWRTEYDRGTRKKPGLMNQGSGTTPNLFGEMVAIGDNAEPRMNILFLRRDDGTEVCRIPVFEDDLSATENALTGVAREGTDGIEYSIIVENNYGADKDNVFVPGGYCKTCEGGVARIDMIPDGSGGYTCEEVWMNPINSCSTVPKLSLANGLLYLHEYEPLPEDDYAWYFTALDFDTGEIVYKVLTGTGFQHTDMGAPITIHPDGELAYIGSLVGLNIIRDVAP